MHFNKIKAAANSFLDKYRNETPATLAAAEQAVGGLMILDGFIGIDNPLGGKKRSGIFGALGGIVFGVIFMAFSYFIVGASGINKLTATTTATVVSVGTPRTSTTTDSNGNQSTDSTCSLTAKYNVNGQDYTEGSSSSSTTKCNLSVGSQIKINYDPSQPTHWDNEAATAKLIFNIFPLVGLLIALSGLVTFVIRLFSIILGWKILQDGRKLAKTLPEGTDLGAMIGQIRTEFATHIFNGGGLKGVIDQAVGAAPAAPVAAPAEPTPTEPTSIPTDPPAQQ